MKPISHVLKALGIPFAYDHFAEGESPAPPFVVYRYPSTNSFAADGIVYYPINEVHLELYTDKKDKAMEKRLELLLDSADLCYQKSEVWIASEELYQVLYIFDEVVKGIFIEKSQVEVLGEVLDKITVPVEVSCTVELKEDDILQKYIQLPHDCDPKRAITLSVQGLSMQQDKDWKLVEQEGADIISWDELGLEDIVQAGDFLILTYYKSSLSDVYDNEELQKKLKALKEKLDNLVEFPCDVVLTSQNISNKYIELPTDCDTSRVITVSLQGVTLQQGVDWDITERAWPDKDLITWSGLRLEDIARAGDSITITYYKKG